MVYISVLYVDEFGRNSFLINQIYGTKLLVYWISCGNTIHYNLKFTPEDIIENNHKTAFLCKSIMDQYQYIIVPIISPFKKSRENAKNIIGPNFVFSFINRILNIIIDTHFKKISQ